MRPDNNGTFVAYVPAISGCHAWGQTPDEAICDKYCVLVPQGGSHSFTHSKD
ncbi:type II toxin-antitoxin system HicB family antitoxin [Nostoc sphaeroides]|uniref:type II toxin-antitoxin system HicB family antitoxin n=1 Tax=Nostoc sphaeroides TaxID=446679 RepID=UPI001CED1EC9|nr:type II toxin-antitoxin system HicB family antitoxin [Nostoc sphaeroides]